MRSRFNAGFATSIGDITQSNYGLLFEASKRNQSLIRDHIQIHGFLSRLLSALGGLEDPKGRLTAFSDALFILSTSLEEHPDSHNLPDVDVPAAAQYMIHAGTILFEECKKG